MTADGAPAPDVDYPDAGQPPSTFRARHSGQNDATRHTAAITNQTRDDATAPITIAPTESSKSSHASQRLLQKPMPGACQNEARTHAEARTADGTYPVTRAGETVSIHDLAVDDRTNLAMMIGAAHRHGEPFPADYEAADLVLAWMKGRPDRSETLCALTQPSVPVRPNGRS